MRAQQQTISNLRRVPHFADIIADRGWHAWWVDSGVPLVDYRAHLEPMVKGGGIPSAFVAHTGTEYLGSGLLIESDHYLRRMRRNLTPWIAAPWVEPEARHSGIAQDLIMAARIEAQKFGHEKCYLCASPDNSPYYLKRGFEQIEVNVGGLNIFSIASGRSSPSSRIKARLGLTGEGGPDRDDPKFSTVPYGLEEDPVRPTRIGG
jgi:GNAT superfamily N-acetyltransferase